MEKRMSIEVAMQEMGAIIKKFQANYGISLDAPPPSFKELHGEFVEVENNRRLKVRFPFDARFANPLGTFQGGVLCATIDNAFGPLSYLALKRPSVTLDLMTQFIRSFSPKDQYIEVEAKVVSISSATLVMQAEVRNAKNKLIATATATFLILQDDMLSRISAGQNSE
jgi:uncharacterized protein (TIGR00369 family)